LRWVIFEQLMKAIEKLEAEEMNEEYSVGKRVCQRFGNMPNDQMESTPIFNHKSKDEGNLVGQRIEGENESITQFYPKLSYKEGNLLVNWDTAPNGYQVTLYQDNQKISSNQFNNPPAIFPTASLAAGTYFIEVKARGDRSSSKSRGSNSQTSLASIVKLKAPADVLLTYNNVTQKFNLTWQKALDARYYLVQLVNVENNNQVLFQKAIPKEENCLDIDVSTLQGKTGFYQAWIQAKGDAEYIDSDISKLEPKLSFFHQSTKTEKILKFLRKNAALLAALALIPFSWLLIQNFISGRVIYVNPVTGNNSADGSKTAPYKTIAYAIQEARSGEKILLEAGYYNESFPLIIPSGVTMIVQSNAKFVIFNDIQNHWASEVIRKLAIKGIISGFPDGSFRPDAKMTRAEYAAFLVKAFNPTQKRLGKDFLDVAQNFWAYNVIQQAYRSKFLTGLPNNNFLPNKDLQRLEIMVSLVSGIGLTTGDENALNFYTDRNSIPDWAKQKVAIATATQLVKGYKKNQLKPLRSATRAEVAVIVYQVLMKTQNFSVTHSAPNFLTQTTKGQ